MTNVLIIENDKDIASLEKDYLEINSYYVMVEESGRAGISRVINDKPDLVIQALNFPDISGFEVCKEIRKNSDIPIIILTERANDIDLVRGLGVGADDYMTKPFNPNELIARVKANLACYERLTGSKDASDDSIQYHDLYIDLTSRRVFVKGEEIIFTTKEFDLLAFLATHPNKVYSKDELFSAVWGMDSLGDIATVTVHIKKIRQKIGQNASQSGYIETVWGSGYRFRILKPMQ